MNQLLTFLTFLGWVTATGTPVFTYRDATVTFPVLQDAGIATLCPNVVSVTHEDIGPRLKARLLDGGAVLRPNQTQVRLYRQAERCPTGSPFDGGAFLIVPGLRQFARQGVTDPTEASIEDSSPNLYEMVTTKTCAQVTGFCGNGPLNVAVDTVDVPACRMPNCWDGGIWVDTAQPNCKRSELPDGGSPRWAGCNVIEPPATTVGLDCVPVECGGVIAGEVDTL